MKISPELINKILQCDFPENCGTSEKFSYNFSVTAITGRSKAMKSIKSTKWKNLCLDKIGDYTAYLCLNHMKEYNEYWNKTVAGIKAEIFPPIEMKIRAALDNKKLTENVLHDILFNLISILMIDFYSVNYIDDFFENLLQVYLSGHLPCGMDGDKLAVY